MNILNVKDWKLSVKLGSLVVMGLVVAIGIGGATLVSKRQSMEDAKRDQTRALVETAHGIVASLQAREASGELSREEAQKRAIEIVRSLRYSKIEYFWINDMQPRMIVHPIKPEMNGTDLSGNADPAGKKIFVAFVDVVKANGAGFVDYQWPKPGADKPVPKISYVKGFAPWGWVIGSGIYVDDLDAEFWADFRVDSIEFGLAAAVYIMLALFMLRSITRPLHEAVEVAKKLAAGDLSQKIDVRSTDEVGQLLAALSNTSGQWSRIVGGIKDSTEQINHASKEIAAGNADLSQRTEQQASSLEETASSMEELTSTVKQNAENARQANQLATGASEVAVRGGEVVREVVNTMGGITESSKKIADIIGVIDGIAFQTNILALNAAVEAARAGEQGRGFAVVASEVRSLAQRSANAAKEIKTLIDDSVGKVDAGSKLVDAAGQTMEEVVTSIKRVTDIMAEITAASQEQSSGIEQVNQAVTQMDEVTQQNAALVEEAAAAAESMQEQANALATAVSVFKLSGEHHAAVAESSWDGQTERRSADRATNVARLPAKKVSAPRAVPASARKTANSDSEWSEF